VDIRELPNREFQNRPPPKIRERYFFHFVKYSHVMFAIKAYNPISRRFKSIDNNNRNSNLNSELTFKSKIGSSASSTRPVIATRSSDDKV